jgi:transglutaminase-like putative cysteine protease
MVFENVSGNRYAAVLSAGFSAVMTNELAAYLRPNQYVNYENAPKTIAKAESLLKGITDPLEKVAVVYRYVVKNLKYDYDKAATVKSGYLPDLDKVLAAKKGICFDYASLMTGMLRSAGVPCKLVVGYAGEAYHAWISVWTEESGWIEGAVFFNGTTWQRMDPTFASTSKESQQILDFIANDANYAVKYLY